MAKDLRRSEWVPPVISRSSNPQGRNVRFGSKDGVIGSALGQKRTLVDVWMMSALPPKADIG